MVPPMHLPSNATVLSAAPMQPVLTALFFSPPSQHTVLLRCNPKPNSSALQRRRRRRQVPLQSPSAPPLEAGSKRSCCRSQQWPGLLLRATPTDLLLLFSVARRIVVGFARRRVIWRSAATPLHRPPDCFLICSAARHPAICFDSVSVAHRTGTFPVQQHNSGNCANIPSGSN